MIDLSAEDVKRLISEISNTNDSPEEWAEKIGIPFDTLAEVAAGMGGGVISRIIRGVQEMADEGDVETVEFDGEMAIPVPIDLVALMSEACLNSIVVGFELHKQLGGVSSAD